MKVTCYCKEGTSSSSFHYNLSSDEQCLVENYSDMYEALSCSMYEALAKQILGLCFLLVFFLLFIYNCWTKRIIQLWNRMSRVPSKNTKSTYGKYTVFYFFPDLITSIGWIFTIFRRIHCSPFVITQMITTFSPNILWYYFRYVSNNVGVIDVFDWSPIITFYISNHILVCSFMQMKFQRLFLILSSELLLYIPSLKFGFG